jgi:hypothetical protein
MRVTTREEEARSESRAPGKEDANGWERGTRVPLMRVLPREEEARLESRAPKVARSRQ